MNGSMNERIRKKMKIKEKKRKKKMKNRIMINGVVKFKIVEYRRIKKKERYINWGKSGRNITAYRFYPCRRLMRRLKGTTKRTLRFTDVLAADGSLPTRSSRINDEQVRGKSQHRKK